MEDKKIRKEVRQILKQKFIKEQEVKIKFNIPVPEDIGRIKNLFKQKGHKLFVVGGAVRDALLGKNPKDYDLATDALPDVVQQILSPFYRTLETGKSFGVINVLTDSGEYEIATFRKDKYDDGEADLESFKNYLKSLNNGKYEEFLNKLAK